MSALNTFQLAFEIQATAHQVIQIVDEAYDESRIIDELSSGILVTTTWHNQGEGGSVSDLVLSRVSDDHVVGYVLSQQIDGEYSDYR